VTTAFALEVEAATAAKRPSALRYQAMQKLARATDVATDRAFSAAATGKAQVLAGIGALIKGPLRYYAAGHPQSLTKRPPTT
jgi:hypothetical protein